MADGEKDGEECPVDEWAGEDAKPDVALATAAGDTVEVQVTALTGTEREDALANYFLERGVTPEHVMQKYGMSRDDYLATVGSPVFVQKVMDRAVAEAIVPAIAPAMRHLAYLAKRKGKLGYLKMFFDFLGKANGEQFAKAQQAPSKPEEFLERLERLFKMVKGGGSGNA